METPSGGATTKAVHQTQKGNGTGNQDQTQKRNFKAPGAFLVGFVLGILVMWLITITGTISPEERAVDETDSESIASLSTDDSLSENNGTTVSAVDNKITVREQLAGNGVALEFVSVTQSGWVVVHESKNGELGNALGARRFDAGSYTDTTVVLLRDTEVGNPYIVVLYNDNGDKEFTLGEDKPLLDSSGNRIDAIFEAIRIDRKI